MLKLAVILFVIIGPSLAGIAVVALLTIDSATSNAPAIVTAALIGALAALPVSLAVASLLSRRGRAVAAASS
jgi:enolase